MSTDSSIPDAPSFCGSETVATPRSQVTPAAMAPLDCWLFDLDNTLYRASSNLFPQIHGRMKTFIADFLGIDLEEAFRLQKQYYHDYGTTLRGLMVQHGLEPERFLEYVHDIDHSVLHPDGALNQALAALPGRKVIFTNGSQRHAEAVLGRLGLSHHFADIFDIKAADYIPKPQVAPYHKIIQRHGVVAHKTAFFEDSPLNLEPAAALGMTTVLVRSDPARQAIPEPYCHYITDDLTAWLWAASKALGKV